MIIFILACIALATLVQLQSPLLEWLTLSPALEINLCLLALSLLLGYFKKLPSISWHDGFATATLLVWYGDWRPLFDDYAPMFFFYPLYFALFSGILTLLLINKSADFDAESVIQLRYMDKMIRFNMPAAIVFVLIAVLISRHYALYAMAMTFFMIRHSITVCLENIDSNTEIR
jgi:hypothetical protein